MNGNVTMNGTTVGSEATYSCNPNIQLVPVGGAVHVHAKEMEIGALESHTV